MNNAHPLIPHPDYEKLTADIQTLQEEINALVLDRDELLYHVCKNIETEYMLKIGALEYKVYEAQCNILRLKRKIEIIQSKINLQQPVVITLIEVQLDEEYKEYTQKLADKLNEINAAFERSSSRALTKEEVREIKTLYAAIVKKIHPDLNPQVHAEKAAKYLAEAITAYKNGDLTGLKAISVLVSDLSGDVEIKGTLDELAEQKNTLLARKEKILNNIMEIKSAYPYNQKEFLSDEIRVKEKINELEHIFNEYKALYNELEEKIKIMIK
jgi:hypothetical protein